MTPVGAFSVEDRGKLCVAPLPVEPEIRSACCFTPLSVELATMCSHRKQEGHRLEERVTDIIQCGKARKCVNFPGERQVWSSQGQCRVYTGATGGWEWAGHPRV